MPDPNTLGADISGVNPTNGQPESWRNARSRYPRDIGQIVNDPSKGPWKSEHNGQRYEGHFDAFEQIVPLTEQLSWVHKFSNGKTYDPGDILIGLGEFLIKQGIL